MSSTAELLSNLTGIDTAKTSYTEVKETCLASQEHLVSRIADLEKVSASWELFQNKLDDFSDWMTAIQNKLLVHENKIPLQNRIEQQEVCNDVIEIRYT